MLHKREEVLQEIFTAVREPKVPICESGSRYEQFLESILTEAYLQILEPKVVIFSRKSDVEVVKAGCGVREAKLQGNQRTGHRL